MEMEPRWRSSTVKLVTGPRLHYVEQGDDPESVAVLFLHGWPDSWFSFSRVLELLPHHYRAFAIDQRGFGDSDRPRDGYHVQDFAGDAAAFLDAVGLARVVLVGHSFGSFVARALAIAAPQRVAGLVLIGTGFSPVNPVTREVQATIKNLEEPVPIEFAREFQAATAYVPLPPSFFDRIVAESLKLPAPLWRATFNGLLEYDDAERLPRITAPTLLLWGERDAIFSSEDQAHVKPAIPATRLRIYPETGHCPNWERPSEVVADLTAFIDEIKSTRLRTCC